MDAYDPWDALEVLERYVKRPDFNSQWRGFLRDCTMLLLPGLPSQVSNWVAVADEFDAGRLDAARLTIARVEAWKFHDDRRDTSPPAELSGIRAAMYRLWPTEVSDEWHESASHFLHFCHEAGLQKSHWWPLLRARFDGILVGLLNAEQKRD